MMTEIQHNKKLMGMNIYGNYMNNQATAVTKVLNTHFYLSPEGSALRKGDKTRWVLSNLE